MAEHSYTYRDPGKLSRGVILICGLAVLVFALSALAALNEWALLDALSRQDFSASSSAREAASYIVLTTRASLVAIIVALVVFLIWVYRTSANAQAMGADLTHSAGFSVGMFFIPGLNLFLPPMMMSELARASISASSWQSQKKSPIVPLWWSIQIIVGVGGIVLAFAAPGRGAPFSDRADFFLWYTAHKVPEILLYLILALLVAKISATQRRQWQEREMAEVTFS